RHRSKSSTIGAPIDTKPPSKDRSPHPRLFDLLFLGWGLMVADVYGVNIAHNLVLIRTTTTTIDVLLLNSMDVYGEVKKSIELVAKQGGKERIEIDPNDE
ncbi:hypothetical protein Gorai_017585, partial [Gossypium raimondii]|nr:hypothetical protein [Gossypium raimondii]